MACLGVGQTSVCATLSVLSFEIFLSSLSYSVTALLILCGKSHKRLL